ncbi:predicted protein [Sclerotinia sclerotiorum 1980 UF-70]|uniref:Uncharacterized protein n=1 Tax=Sclerotinia sclerotiorum (strain ATCC 18683 / 1980 / Ss-1) TaxID=665079 RepID=A7EZ44_SCLS1|nr:predicted protein [Sclerotinia sclerotiorum 1980 UF-70]EDN94736.1 predicted protein [Sclerotinia sclerotiorum 1980 UF-70]
MTNNLTQSASLQGIYLNLDITWLILKIVADFAPIIRMIRLTRSGDVKDVICLGFELFVSQLLPSTNFSLSSNI